MRKEEFDIVRDLISGRGQQWSPSPYTARALEPASFREIDGHELARQYVAHRKFRESERLAQQSGAEEDMPDRVRLGSAAGDRWQGDGLADFHSEQPDGWFTSLARFLGFR